MKKADYAIWIFLMFLMALVIVAGFIVGGPGYIFVFTGIAAVLYMLANGINN